MKKISCLFIFVSLILVSCEKTPTASFTTDTDEPEVGKPVLFNNNSHNADRFEWDFGDGYVSDERSPAHSFSSTGSFDVTLTAFSKGGHSDMASLTVTIMVPTLLVIEVREYYSEDLIPGASIILYSSVPDWDAQTNPVIEGFTDESGVAVFANLDPFVYYADVWEATHDNYTLRNEDVEFIRTPEVLRHQISRFKAWVDVADHGKGIARGARDITIKKFERKVTDKLKAVNDSGSENWQELYKRRVIITAKPGSAPF